MSKNNNQSGNGKKHSVLVTGGAGLIGLEVSRQLAEMGHEVRLFDLGEQVKRVEDAIPKGIKVMFGSIVDLASLRDAMEGVDTVIHLAAMLGVQRTEKDKLRCMEINVDGTKNVLDCAVQHRLKKIVFASSSEVYGEPTENPVTEKTVTQGKTVYAVSKMAGEELCKAYGQRYPLNWAILRYFNCYGPYQTAQFVISKFIYNVMSNKPPVIYGDGQQLRSYTFVSDTARATVLAALEDSANSETINVGNSQSKMSLTSLAKLVIKIAGKDGAIQPLYLEDFNNSDREKSREIFERYCDASKLKKLLGWECLVSVEDGIRRVMKSGKIFDRWENLYDESL
jgi:UDP-glucose 4-epimerase